tara:strand:- start:57 stop:311 length:255 start_codon:yes stop_codon:yes gene_type:complete
VSDSVQAWLDQMGSFEPLRGGHDPAQVARMARAATALMILAENLHAAVMGPEWAYCRPTDEQMSRAAVRYDALIREGVIREVEP